MREAADVGPEGSVLREPPAEPVQEARVADVVEEAPDVLGPLAEELEDDLRVGPEERLSLIHI